MEATIRCPFCAEEILAAARKCKHCGSNITIGDCLPRPIEKPERPPQSAIVRFGGGFLVLAIIAAMAVECSNSSNPSPPPAIANDPAPLPTDSQDGPPLAGPAALEAFNAYMIAVQTKVRATDLFVSTWTSRIRQDLQFQNLAAYRKDAADLKDQALKASSAVAEIEIPDNLSEADAKYFEDVQTAAAEILDTQVEVAVDIAVNADTGMDTLAEIPQVEKTAKSARKALKSAAMKGFTHFGALPARVNSETLTLKPLRSPTS